MSTILSRLGYDQFLISYVVLLPKPYVMLFYSLFSWVWLWLLEKEEEEEAGEEEEKEEEEALFVYLLPLASTKEIAEVDAGSNPD